MTGLSPSPPTLTAGPQHGAPAPDQVVFAPEHEASSILSTLNDDGTRRWICPRVSPGRFLTGRRVVAYALIAIFTLLPHLRIAGKPVVLLNLAERRFTLGGMTFYPTDTLLLALLMVVVFLGIFWLTALFGRAWCGWACPQTVYMEFVYRPIERLFDGAPGRAARNWFQRTGAGKLAKFAVFFAVSSVLAHTFLSYFVPPATLWQWITSSPTEHPAGFLIVTVVTLAMLFDFGYFREQVCLVACPYGRFQSVLLDRYSLTVRYDRKRGEPRSKIRAAGRHASADVSLSVLSPAPKAGDCIDCRMCVATCPTGIDIREGLQMECIGCTQCIDACDAIMDKVGRPRGLVRYSSLAALEGDKLRLLRPRVVVYPAIIAVLSVIFLFVLSGKGGADVTILRGLGRPFVELPAGEVANGIRVKVVNRAAEAATFTITAATAQPSATPLRVELESSPIVVKPGEMLTFPARVVAPRSLFASAGHADINVTLSGPSGFSARIAYQMLGPVGESTDQPPGDQSQDKGAHP